MRFILLFLMVLLFLAAFPGCPKPTTAAPSGLPAPAKAAPAKAAPAKAGPGKALTLFIGSASLPALKELGPLYESQTGWKVEITSGGSGSVMTQFVQEHYGDLYIPGSDDFMDKAEKKDAVLKETRAPLVYLVPMINVAKGNPKKIQALQDLARADVRVVLGEPESVCLGEIAKKALTQEGIWAKVEPRVASYATSCEDVLNNLLMGEADAIIGWDVFAKQHPDEVESLPLPPKLTRVRNIPAAVIKWSKQPEEAKKLIEFLASPQAKEVFKKHGYTIER